MLGSSTVIFEKTPESTDLLDEMFRAAHSLKGMAATMGVTAMAELTHRLEDVFDGFRKHMIQPDSCKIGAVVEGINMLDIMLDEYRVTGNVSVNYDTIKDRLVRIVDGSDEQLTETETETETESESEKTSDTCDKVIR